MLPLAVKLLAALTCFTGVYITAAAADSCPTTIPGLPGRDGRDGRDGAPGLPGAGALTCLEQQQLKDDILSMVRDEMSMFGCCNTATSTVSTTSQVINPTESVYQPTSTPQPSPTPEPPCEPIASSCKELYRCNQTTPSGYYNIATPQGVERVYCEMNTTNCGNITGGWTRVAYIDMTDANNACPENLTLTVQSSVRMCTSSNAPGCASITFPTHMHSYTKVCGRARGYQYHSLDAFNLDETLEGDYAEGVSITHGSPRNHIWTFAAGLSKGFDYGYCCNCPCAAYPIAAAPAFIGENYFCESGKPDQLDNTRRWYLDDPLWDSQGCPSGSTCCDRGGPWFDVMLSQETSDDIEMRVCFNEDSEHEDVGVDQLEIYIN